MTIFCRKCSEPVLSEWKGWPEKDLVPKLVEIPYEVCRVCGEGPNDPIESEDISWLNVHGFGSTGLPSHWILVEQQQQDANDVDGWGLPYFSTQNCPRCGEPSILIELNFPREKNCSAIVRNAESCD